MSEPRARFDFHVACVDVRCQNVRHNAVTVIVGWEDLEIKKNEVKSLFHVKGSLEKTVLYLYGIELNFGPPRNSSERLTGLQP